MNTESGIPTSACVPLPPSSPMFLMLIDFSFFQMMECGQCKCWVHAKCEGLSDEKYQVLSYLPESVEFVCRFVIVLSCTSKQEEVLSTYGIKEFIKCYMSVEIG